MRSSSRASIARYAAQSFMSRRRRSNRSVRREAASIACPISLAKHPELSVVRLFDEVRAAFRPFHSVSKELQVDQVRAGIVEDGRDEGRRLAENPTALRRVRSDGGVCPPLRPRNGARIGEGE